MSEREQCTETTLRIQLIVLRGALAPPHFSSPIAQCMKICETRTLFMRPYANWPCRRCKFSIFPTKVFALANHRPGKSSISHILFMRQPDLQPRIFLLFSSVRAPHLTRTQPLNYEKRLDKFFFSSPIPPKASALQSFQNNIRQTLWNV